MPLTDEQEKKYIEAKGCFCPHCGEEDIEGDFVETDEGTAWQTIRCNICKKRWRDLYDLTGIAELEN